MDRVVFAVILVLGIVVFPVEVNLLPLRYQGNGGILLDFEDTVQKMSYVGRKLLMSRVVGCKRVIKFKKICHKIIKNFCHMAVDRVEDIC